MNHTYSSEIPRMYMYYMYIVVPNFSTGVDFFSNPKVQLEKQWKRT